MPTASRVGDTIEIETEYRDRDLIRQVPGVTFARPSGPWRMPLSWTGCKSLRAVFGERLDVTDELSTWAWAEFHGRIEPATEARARAMDPDSKLPDDDPLAVFLSARGL